MLWSSTPQAQGAKILLPRPLVTCLAVDWELVKNFLSSFILTVEPYGCSCGNHIWRGSNFCPMRLKCTIPKQLLVRCSFILCLNEYAYFSTFSFWGWKWKYSFLPYHPFSPESQQLGLAMPEKFRISRGSFTDQADGISDAGCCSTWGTVTETVTATVAAEIC